MGVERDQVAGELFVLDTFGAPSPVEVHDDGKISVRCEKAAIEIDDVLFCLDFILYSLSTAVESKCTFFWLWLCRVSPSNCGASNGPLVLSLDEPAACIVAGDRCVQLGARLLR